MNVPGTTRIRIEPQRTTLVSPDGSEVVAATGFDTLAGGVFHHEPPQPAELEQAIDLVEEALMATHLPHAERGDLVTSDPLLNALPGLRHPGARLTRDQIEALFQQLAATSLGRPAGQSGLPEGRQSAAALLILRERMHHLGYLAVRLGHA